MKKKLSILLIAALLLAAVPPLGVQAAGSRIMRIGLAYKNDTKAAVSLRNKVGGGYALGYYDDQRQFVTLGWTEQSKISVLITQNQYLTSAGGYSYTASDKGAVGCFHVQMPGSYADFASAQAAAESVEDGFVAWVRGTYYVRAGSYTRRAAAEEAAAAIEGAEMGETSGFGYSVVPTGSSRILFQFDANVDGENGAFGVLPIAGEGEKAVTVYNEGQSYYGGFRFERINGGESTVVNMIELEDYIKGVVPYEMSNSWPVEALKAQAVCARTYAGRNSRHAEHHFDLCTTTDCQAYKGTSGAGSNSDRAVEETAGKMIYYNGKIVTDAVYYSSNGGASEDAKNVWGGERGYLKGKLDPYEGDAAAVMTKSQLSYYRWSKTVTAATVKTKLKNLGRDCGDIVGVTLKLTDVGNVYAATFLDANGKSWTISPGDKVRTTFGLNSNRYSVTSSGGAQGGYAIAGAAVGVSDLTGLYAINGAGKVGALSAQSYAITDSGIKLLEPAAGTAPSGSEALSFTFTGTGWGHNVGMSQWGAYAMAKRGYSYLDILTFYYTDITVE